MCISKEIMNFSDKIDFKLKIDHKPSLEYLINGFWKMPAHQGFAIRQYLPQGRTKEICHLIKLQKGWFADRLADESVLSYTTDTETKLLNGIADNKDVAIFLQNQIYPFPLKERIKGYILYDEEQM